MFRWFVRFLILLLIIYVIYVIAYPFFVNVSYLKNKNPEMTAMMKYRIKQWEKQGKKIKINKIWVPLNRISPYLVKAVLISEDDKFYSHSGFDIEGIKKAIEKDLKEKKFNPTLTVKS